MMMNVQTAYHLHPGMKTC